MSTGWNLAVNSASTDVLSSLSTEYVTVPMSVTKDGVPYNPTSDPVQFAFVTGTSTPPQTGSWVAGEWDTLPGPIYPYQAKCLIGPAGTITLAPGTYIRWVKVTDNPEVPVLQAGQVIIF